MAACADTFQFADPDALKTGKPTPSKKEQEAMKRRRPVEQLPESKTNQFPSGRAKDPEYTELSALVRESIGKPQDALENLPGKISTNRLLSSNVPLPSLAESRRIQSFLNDHARRLNEKLIESGKALDLLPPVKEAPSVSSLSSQTTEAYSFGNAEGFSVSTSPDPKVSSAFSNSESLSSTSSSQQSSTSTTDVHSLQAATDALETMDTAHAQSWLDSLPEVPSDQAWLELLQNQSSSLSPLNQQLVKELAAEPSKGLQRQDFHDILYMNSKLGRAEQAEKTITLMQEYNIEPTTIDYNQLMNAYAFNKDVDGTLNTFKRMMKSQRQPDAWSFGIVIKCLTQNRKLNDAFLFYDQMKLLQIPTTQPIISTLIQGCVRVGDFNRAWRLFDHLRTMVARPDEITYSLMISLCAKTGHVERALTLFHEMSQDPGPHGHRLFPLESTFAALIHACAKRPEYYGTAMDLVQQLEEIGYQCDRITYNYLFLACKNHGDLPRARALWKDMVSESVARRDGEVAVVVPDATTYALLLGTYGRMPNVVENLWRRTVWRAQLGQFEKQVLFAKMGLENEERLKQGKTPIDINEWIIQDDYDPDRPAELVGVRDLELEELRLYLLDGMSEDDRLQVCRREALQLCDLIRHRVAPSLESATRSSGPAPLTMTATLLNTFIETMGTYCLKRRAITVYENDFAKYGVEKNSTTYLRTLRALFASYVSFKEMELSMERISGMKTPNASLGKEVVATAGDEVEPEDPVYNIAKAWDVIRDYERFRNQRQFPSRWDELEKKSVRARYQERGITHYDRKTEYVIYKTMILGLTRSNDLEGATRLLSTLVSRGHARVSNALHVQPDLYSPLLAGATPPGQKPSIDTAVHAMHPIQKQNIVISTVSAKDLKAEEDTSASKDSKPQLTEEKSKPREGTAMTEEESKPMKGASVTEEKSRPLKDTRMMEEKSSALLFERIHRAIPQSESSEDSTPHYVAPIASFRKRDFAPLIDKVRNSGDRRMLAHLEKVLWDASIGLEREEKERLQRMERAKKQLRLKVQGAKFDAKHSRI